MRLLDRVLFGISAVSLVGIVLIVSAGDISAGNVRKVTPISKTTEDLPVLSKEIDGVIEQYFQTIRENPDQINEEERLLQAGGQPETLPVVTEEETPKTTQKILSEQVQYVSHKISSGESLWLIAGKYSVPVYTILSANPDVKSKVIHPGETLRIPDRKGIVYRVRSGDSLSAIAARYKVSTNDIRRTNSLSGDVIHAKQELFLPGVKEIQKRTRTVLRKMFLWPLSTGRITSDYGWRLHPIYKKKLFHSGIDIGAPQGTSIRAAADGVVIYSGYSKSYGNMVVLKHRNGYMTVYAHASRLLVKKGKKVSRGDKIAKVGATGAVTGAHLHFEVKKNGKTLDPQKAMQVKIKETITEKI